MWLAWGHIDGKCQRQDLNPGPNDSEDGALSKAISGITAPPHPVRVWLAWLLDVRLWSWDEGSRIISPREGNGVGEGKRSYWPGSLVTLLAQAPNPDKETIPALACEEPPSAPSPTRESSHSSAQIQIHSAASLPPHHGTYSLSFMNSLKYAHKL